MSHVFLGLPTYNGAAHLRQAVDSVCAQTFQDWTLLISDNGSTDGTQQICEEYARRDARIRYHRHQQNQGAWFNFKFVLQQADAPYFAWFPDDYVMEAHFLEVCVDLLDKDAAIGTAMTNLAYAKSNGKIVSLNAEGPKILSSGDRGRRLVYSYLLAKEMAVLFYAVFRLEVLREAVVPYARHDRVIPAFDCYVVLRALCRGGLAFDPGFRQILPYEDAWDRRSFTYNYLGFGTGSGVRFVLESLKALPWRWRPGALWILCVRWAIGGTYKGLYLFSLYGWSGLWRKLRSALQLSHDKQARHTDERTRS